MRIVPGNQRNSSTIDFLQAAVNFFLPTSFRVFIDFDISRHGPLRFRNSP